MKKVFLIYLTACVLLLICSCSGDNTSSDNPGKSPETAKKPRVIYANTGAKNTGVSNAIKAGMFKAIEEENYQLIFEADANGYIEPNLIYIQQAIDKKVDGMIISAIGTGYTPLINKAVDAGIPVVTVHSDAPDSKRKAYCGPNYKEYAKKAAHWMAQVLNSKGKIGIMQGAMGIHENSIAQIFKETINTNYPLIEIVAEDGDTIDPAKAIEKVRKMVNNNPGLDGVFNTTAATVDQWDQVIKERNLQGRLIIIAMDTLLTQLRLVKSGTLYGVISQGLFEEGYLAVKALFDENPKEIQYVKSEFITLENKDLLEKYEIENKLIEDIIMKHFK